MTTYHNKAKYISTLVILIVGCSIKLLEHVHDPFFGRFGRINNRFSNFSRKI